MALDTNGRGTISVAAPGRYEVVAVATDVDGLVGVARTILKTRDPNDVAVPAVALEAPLFAILSDGIIRGTISDLNLDEWKLEIQRLGETEFRTIATGHEPVTNGVLARLDVQDLPNDFYVLRLSARDIARRLGRAETIIELSSISKRHVVVTEVDVTAVVGGVTVDVARRYDSVHRAEAGRLGNGWRLLNREVNFRSSVQPTGYEAQGLHSAYRDGTRNLPRVPRRRRTGLCVCPVLEQIPGLSYYRAAWQSLSSNPNGWTLESPGLKLMRGGDQFFELSTGYPYNPVSPLYSGNDFALTAPGGTQYAVDARLGITAQTTPGGQTVYLGDNGIVAPGGEAIQFITDGEGRISRLVGPGGQVLNYQYDEAGNLVAVRSPRTGQTDRYGYSSTEPGRLQLAVDGSGSGSLFAYSQTAPPTVAPISGDLGAAGTFTGRLTSARLPAAEAKRYAFSVRQSELDSTATGEVLVRAIVETSGGLQVGIPAISGLAPRSTSSNGNRVEAIYAVSREGLYEISIVGTGGTSGDFVLELVAAGDLNRDAVVDGLDSDLQAALVGVQRGDPGYDAAADVDGSGTIDFNDRFVLFRNAGFTANSAPVADATFATQLAHVDLALQFELASAVIDPDGDPIYFQVLSTLNGTVSLSPDGRTLTFLPAGGYSGPATIQITADDGFNGSEPITLAINVSAAELLDIEIVNRQPQMNAGERATLTVLGRFADQENVPLIGNYLSYFSSDIGVVEIDGSGQLKAIAEGYAAVTVSRGFVRDATAVTVGQLFDALNRDEGILVYPGSLTLPLVSGLRQFVVKTIDGQMDLSAATSGTVYVLGDSRVLNVTESGLVTSSALGETTLTIINGPAEQTVRVRVVEPEIGSATFAPREGCFRARWRTTADTARTCRTACRFRLTRRRFPPRASCPRPISSPWARRSIWTSAARRSPNPHSLRFRSVATSTPGTWSISSVEMQCWISTVSGATSGCWWRPES